MKDGSSGKVELSAAGSNYAESKATEATSGVYVVIVFSGFMGLSSIAFQRTFMMSFWMCCSEFWIQR